MHDWDSTEVPILADLTIGGQPRKVVMFANRNGFFYTLDRTTGKVIVAKPFVQTTWAKEIGATAGRCCCRPHAGREGRADLSGPHRRHQLLAAVVRSAQRLFFVNAREVCATFYALEAGVHAGRALHRRRGAAGATATTSGYGALRAIDPATGERKWEFQYLTPSRPAC